MARKVIAKTKTAVKLSGTLTIKDMVDRGWELSNIVKETKKELDLIKAKLKEVATNENVMLLQGNTHVAVFSPKTIVTVNVKKLYEYLFNKGLGSRFWECVKVGIEKAREVVNEYDLNEISTEEEIPRNSVSFK